MKDKLTITIVGRSGCGKGTQAQFIFERLKKRGAEYFETGAALRKMVLKQANPTARSVREVLKQGGLVPGWVAAFVWLKGFIEKGVADKHLIFDGSPRRLWDAELIDEVIVWHGRTLPLCIYLEVSEEEAARRLALRGRTDDTRRAIQNRMRYFAKDVMPVVNYYRKLDRLIKVDGNVPPSEVWRVLDQALAKKLGQLWPRR